MTASALETGDTAQLIAIVSNNAWLMDSLAAAASLGLNAWCIGAGAVRNVVWDHFHAYSGPSSLADVDVVYFDADNLDPGHDAHLQRQLCQLRPDVPWEVSNQAAVHTWFEAYFGHPVAPLTSLDEAVASWPEYATAVGLYLDARGALQVIAPHGLGDLMSMRIRRNPTRASAATYQQRVAQKRYVARWPKVSVEA